MPPRRSTGKGVRALGKPHGPTPIAPAATSENDTNTDISKISGGIAALTMDVPLANAKKPKRAKIQPFRFFDLPYELRLEVYGYHFANTGNVLDLDPDNYKRIHQKLAILRTCRDIYREASYSFYSTHPVRAFPTHPGRFFKTNKPLLARFKPNQRANITTLELRLGPGWSKPPRGWVVNEKLGLSECVNVRKITIFLECDPSNDIFKGFRQANGFYEGFSSNLLKGMLDEMPWVKRLEFDAWPSVKKSGALMTALLEVAAERDMSLSWGPEKGWTDAEEEAERPIPANLNAPMIVGIPGSNKIAVMA